MGGHTSMHRQKLLTVFRSTKNFMKKYNLVLTAATFLILDSSEDSMEVSQCACASLFCSGNKHAQTSQFLCRSASVRPVVCFRKSRLFNHCACVNIGCSSNGYAPVQQVTSSNIACFFTAQAPISPILSLFRPKSFIFSQRACV
jgi:hypothetical protein